MNESHPHSDAAPPLCIVLWSVSPEDPIRAVTPFVFAAAAAALDCPVEMLFTAGSVRLLVQDVAAACHTADAGLKTLYDFMREAHDTGVRFYACSMAMHAYVSPEEPLVPEFDGIRGVTTAMMSSLEYGARLLVF